MMLLCAYPNQELRIRKLDESATFVYADDTLEFSSSRVAKNSELFDAVLFVVQVYIQATRPLGERIAAMQEVCVRDQEDVTTVACLFGDAVGSMRANHFDLSKRGNLYKSELQTWGTRMVEPCPEDLHFPVEGEPTEI